MKQNPNNNHGDYMFAFTCRMPHEVGEMLHDRLGAVAYETGLKKGKLITLALEAYLTREEKRLGLKT